MTTATRGRLRLERADHPLQTAEQPPAIAALTSVALHPCPLRTRQLAVDQRRHVARRPSMIEAEARLMEEVAH
jgi:hypothetical protein